MVKRKGAPIFAEREASMELERLAAALRLLKHPDASIPWAKLEDWIKAHWREEAAALQVHLADMGMVVAWRGRFSDAA